MSCVNLGMDFIEPTFDNIYGAAYVEDNMMSTEGYLLLLHAYNLQDGEVLKEVFQVEGIVTSFEHVPHADSTCITLSLVNDEEIVINISDSSNEKRLLESLKIGSCWRAQGYAGKKGARFEMNATYLGLQRISIKVVGNGSAPSQERTKDDEA